MTKRNKSKTKAEFERPEPELSAEKEKYFDMSVMAVLFAFGVYQSIIYFGHKVVPISDFTSIVRIGKELLSFQIPSNYKYAPVVGSLQVLLSHLFKGPYPDLKGGWLLSCILHPLNLIFFYLIGKKILNRAAVFFALIAILNYQLIYMLREPLVETSLLFFSLATIYLIFQRSRWAYVLAAVTTMVRYEGAALILAAFVMDMIYSDNNRQRLKAFFYSALATMPLMVWMLGTVLSFKSGESHYLNVLFEKDYSKSLAGSVENRTGIMLHLKLLWEVGFRPLFTLDPQGGKDFADSLFNITKVLAFGCFCFGAVYGLCKKNWNILVLLIFFVPYFILHAFYPYPIRRFHTNIFWIAQLIVWFAAQSGWSIINKNERINKWITSALQLIVVIIAGIWLAELLPYLPKLGKISETSAYLPVIGIVLTVVFCIGRFYIYWPRKFLREAAIVAFVSLAIVSNQFLLASSVRDGKDDAEFKQLADWYLENATGEKLAVYMCGTIWIFTPEYTENIVQFPQADSTEELIKACYKENITNLVWASREGLNPSHTGYRKLNLQNTIAFLRKPADEGPLKFITQIGSKQGYVNIFKLRPIESNTGTRK